jgi:hypothetical protein
MASSAWDDPPWVVKTCERIESGRSRQDTQALSGPDRWQEAMESTPPGLTAKAGAEKRRLSDLENAALQLAPSRDAYKRVKMDLAVAPASFVPTRHTQMVLGRPVQVANSSLDGSMRIPSPPRLPQALFVLWEVASPRRAHLCVSSVSTMFGRGGVEFGPCQVEGPGVSPPFEA